MFWLGRTATVHLKLLPVLCLHSAPLSLLSRLFQPPILPFPTLPSPLHSQPDGIQERLRSLLLQVHGTEVQVSIC